MKCINLCKYKESLFLHTWSFGDNNITPCSLRLYILCQMVHAHSNMINMFVQNYQTHLFST